MLISSLLLGLSPDADVWRNEGLFARWNRWTFVPVLSMAFGGVLVGVVTKVVGGVKKSFAAIGGIILTCMLRCFLTSELPSGVACVAVPLAASSIYLHSNFPPRKAVQ